MHILHSVYVNFKSANPIPQRDYVMKNEFKTTRVLQNWEEQIAFY